MIAKKYQIGIEIFYLRDCIIKENLNSINWEDVSINVDLIKHEDFIDKYKNVLHWNIICEHHTLSEDFIEKYKNYVDWIYISKYQTLSENFIKKYKNKVDWDFISKYQTLSFLFIFKMKDYINWNIIKEKYNMTKNDIVKSINREESNNFTLNI